jgi:hypothetical protein
VSNKTFPGYAAFLEEAARQIGHPEAEAPARRITTLSALANLCAQASLAEPAHVPSILVKAAEFRDQLHAAYEAAELMLAGVSRARGLIPEPPRRGGRAGRRRSAQGRLPGGIPR